MTTITITRPSLPTRLTTIAKGHYVYLPVGAAPKPTSKPSPKPTYRTLPVDSLFCDALQVIATSDNPPMDYLTRVHGITSDEVRFLSRLGLVSICDNRVYVTDSGLSELS